MGTFDGTDWWDKPWERFAYDGESWVIVSSETDGSEG